jgi:acyl-CoA reductase-like NAD-dependent aldehyde dehydrogenase
MHHVDDPFRGSEAASVPLSSFQDCSILVDRARNATQVLKDIPLGERKAMVERAILAMERRVGEIAIEISQMMGKPVRQARNEVAGMAMRARHMADIAESALSDDVLESLDHFERRIVREPLGIVLDLPAWNYPLLTAVNSVVPAFLAGNAVLLKHSPRTPTCGDFFARAFREAGAPEGTFTSFHCDHPTTERLVGDSRIDSVVYTGSVFGGHRIQEAASKRFAHLTLELGGNDPAYVMPDCDFKQTVDNIVDGAIYNAGQSCCAVERVYVHRSLYKQFIEACIPLVEAYVVGDPLDERTTLGPMAQPGHVAELEEFIVDARARGARVLRGGNRTSVNGKGRFFEATLVMDVPQDARLMRAESFGPIVAVSPVDSDEEALRKMNDSRLGLTASLWTEDRERAMRLAQKLDYGTVYMNRCDSVDPALPWSGVKDSGRGLSLSRLGFDQVTRPKSMHFRLRFPSV